jgi:hypothetical protein
MTAATLKYLLFATIIILMVMALFYLLKRRLPLFDSLAWALLAIFVPILGPIIVIALCPTQTSSS